MKDHQTIEKGLRFDPDALSNLSANDRHLFETFGSGPAADIPYKRINEAFEAHARSAGGNTALEHAGRSVSYADLNRRADQLARRMRQLGVRPGDAVCLFGRRSIALVTGILATLKCDAAYVPQDVGVATRHQLEHIMRVSDCRLVLTITADRDCIPDEPNVPVLSIESELQAEDHEMAVADLSERDTPTRPRPCNATIAGRCFILFTSGTTGDPNGVQVTHANVCNLLLCAPGNLGIQAGVRVGQILNIAFDMAAWEILGCLANGGTLVIRGSDFQAVAERVNVLIATPSILARIDPVRATSVKTVAVAGEPCPRPLADAWGATTRFHNGCGPTETTIVNTLRHYRPEDPRLTIGPPTPNNTVYVLDQHRQPCAIGEVGEMWAGGDCVSAGYIGNEALTAERYVPDPFLGGKHRMFRTRDLGRWTADGSLEHFGRTDGQVKVRGFRVELDSVSRVLETLEGCQAAITVKLDDRYLAAVISPSTLDPETARSAVRARLPYYCVPIVVVCLDAIPLTDRGKCDKRRLLPMLADAFDALTHKDIARLEQARHAVPSGTTLKRPMKTRPETRVERPA